MPAQTEKVQARIHPDLKKSAENVFKRLGLKPTDAIRLFYRQVELHQGIPFDIKIPNDVTLAALQEASHPENLESFDSVEALFADLDDDE